MMSKPPNRQLYAVVFILIASICLVAIGVGIYGSINLVREVSVALPATAKAREFATEEAKRSGTVEYECADPLGCVSYAEGEPVRLASALVISGPNIQLGQDSQYGVEIALDFKGEVFGHPLELQAEDDGCPPQLCKQPSGFQSGGLLFSQPAPNQYPQHYPPKVNDRGSLQGQDRVFRKGLQRGDYRPLHKRGLSCPCSSARYRPCAVPPQGTAKGTNGVPFTDKVGWVYLSRPGIEAITGGYLAGIRT